MKLILVVAAAAMLIAATPRASKAQTWPWLYTISGGLVDGEPNPTYTGSPPGPHGQAYVSVYGSSAYYVKNIDTEIHIAWPAFTMTVWINDSGGNSHLLTFKSGSAVQEIDPGIQFQYSLNGGTGGQLGVGSYTAMGMFTLGDSVWMVDAPDENVSMGVSINAS